MKGLVRKEKFKYLSFCRGIEKKWRGGIGKKNGDEGKLYKRERKKGEKSFDNSKIIHVWAGPWEQSTHRHNPG